MRDDHCFMPVPKRTLVIIAFAALYLIWGSTYLGIRFAIESIPPFLMAGARFLLAGMIMSAIAWSQGIGKSTWANWRVSLVVGACLLLAGNGGVTIAEQYIDTGLAALIVAIVPIYIVILGWATGTAPKPAPIVCIRLVGRIALFAQREACTFSVPHGSPANALRRDAAFACRHCDWRTSEFSSAFNLGVVARVFHLS